MAHNPDLDIPAFLVRKRGDRVYRGRSRSVDALPAVEPMRSGKLLKRAAASEKAAIDAEVLRICRLAEHGRVKK